MRKLNFLKAIVDYVYIISVIASPLAVIFSVLTLFNLTSGKILEYVGIWEKIAPLFVLAGIGLFVYALYYFKKLLANFKGKLIFETENCQFFHKIGKAILYFSLILFLFGFIPKSTQTTTINVTFGFSPSLFIVALGLFFLVLAEVFKMGKQLKEENDLTI